MTMALNALAEKKSFPRFPITDYLAATSVGILKNDLTVLDLNYAEDSKAHVDMNVVMTGNGEFVELQGTGEESTFSYAQLQDLLNAAQEGLTELFEQQKNALGEEITRKIDARRAK
jgi:ribonuclease PH